MVREKNRRALQEYRRRRAVRSLHRAYLALAFSLSLACSVSVGLVYESKLTRVQAGLDSAQAEVADLRARLDSAESELRWFHQYVTPDAEAIARIAREHGRSEPVAREIGYSLVGAGLRFGVRPWVLAAIAAMESAYVPGRIGPTGDHGLMQVVRRYWRAEVERVCGPWVRGAIRFEACAGAYVFAHYYHSCGERLECALARYNSGDYDRQGRFYARLVARTTPGILD